MNDEIQMPKPELMTNDKCRSVALRHSNLVILSSFVIRASAFLLSIFPSALQAADKLGVLGTKPKWDVLEKYQETITHDDFARLIQDVYCTHGVAPDLIAINDTSAQILTNRAAQSFFTLRFAKDDVSVKPVPRLW